MDKVTAAKIAAETISLAILNLVEKMRPPLSSPDRPRVALYLTIAENYQACLVLIRADMATHSAVHVRAMIESYTHMQIIGRDVKHIEQMKYDQLYGQNKVIDGLLADFDLPKEFKEILEKKTLESTPAAKLLRDTGLRPQKISKLISTEFPHLAIPYSVLSGFTHGDLATIALGHQGQKGMSFLAATPDSIIVTIISFALQVIVPATLALKNIAMFPPEFFDSQYKTMESALTEFYDRFEAGTLNDQVA